MKCLWCGNKGNDDIFCCNGCEDAYNEYQADHPDSQEAFRLTDRVVEGYTLEVA